MRGKHRRDQNHGKQGWVGGNPRYKRNSRKANKKHQSMKGLKRQ